MKILASMENFYPPIGGAEVSMEGLLNEIGKKNEVHVTYVGKKKKSILHLIPKTKRTVLKNIPILNRTIIRQYIANIIWKRHLREAVRAIKPDIIFTQLEYTPSSIDVAKENDIKTVVFLNNYDHFCPFSFRNGIDPFKWKKNKFLFSPLSYKLQYPFVTKYLAWHEKALKNADIIISASNYMSNILKKYYGLESVVFDQILDLENFIARKNKREYITFINPIHIKGASIVLELAKNIDKKFLVVEWKDNSWKEMFSELENVTWFSDFDDMREVYGKTRILLIPSIWPEILGRIALEAQINGIPCIGSNMGGIPEAIGKGGIIVKDVFNIKSWINAINSLDDNRAYRKFSTLAKKHGKELTKKKQLDRFNKIIKSI